MLMLIGFATFLSAKLKPKSIFNSNDFIATIPKNKKINMEYLHMEQKILEYKLVVDIVLLQHQSIL